MNPNRGVECHRADLGSARDFNERAPEAQAFALRVSRGHIHEVAAAGGQRRQRELRLASSRLLCSLVENHVMVILDAHEQIGDAIARHLHGKRHRRARGRFRLRRLKGDTHPGRTASRRQHRARVPCEDPVGRAIKALDGFIQGHERGV